MKPAITAADTAGAVAQDGGAPPGEAASDGPGPPGAADPHAVAVPHKVDVIQIDDVVVPLRVHLDGAGKDRAALPLRIAVEVHRPAGDGQVPLIGDGGQVEIYHVAVPHPVLHGVHQGLEILDGIHGRVLRVDVHSLDQVHVQRLVEQDHVPVFHGDGPGAPGGVFPAQEVGEAGEGGIRSIVVVGRITIADVGGGIVRRVKFRGDRRHLLQENLPGVDAGVLVVDEQADGEGTVCVPLCDLGDDRGGLIGGRQLAL